MSSMLTSRSKYFWYSSLIRLLSSTDPLRSSSWNISLKIYSVFLQPILSCNFLTTFSNICSENLGKFSGQFFLLLFIQSLIFAFFFEIFWQLLTKCQISLHRVAIEGEIKNLPFCTLYCCTYRGRFWFWGILMGKLLQSSHRWSRKEDDVRKKLSGVMKYLESLKIVFWWKKLLQSCC